MNNMNETLLILHADSRRDDAAKIVSICQNLGIRPVIVPAEQEILPLGVLAGDTGWMSSKASMPCVTAVEEMMLVLCHFSDHHQDLLLKTLRLCGFRDTLKAVLTKYNAFWNAPALYGQLRSEREQFMGKHK